MNKSVPTWLEIVWTYNVEAIDYWTIFSMKIILKFGGILGVVQKSNESDLI
jgi:hypothetical protein